MRRIEIGGQVLDIAGGKPLPARSVREAWVSDGQGGVSIDQAKALALTKTRLLADIDARAEDLREKVSTKHVGKSHEYAFLALEAAAVISIQAGQVPNAPPITRAAYPLLAASIGVDVPNTNSEAADLSAAAQVVQSKRGQMYAAYAAIRAARLAGAKAVNAATTYQQAESAFAAIAWPAI